MLSTDGIKSFFEVKGKGEVVRMVGDVDAYSVRNIG